MTSYYPARNGHAQVRAAIDRINAMRFTVANPMGGKQASLCKITSMQIQSASKRPRALLMMPLRRCGSHALRLRLNFNIEFYSPYPLHIVDFMPLRRR
jgi:hypothetical protein